MEEEIKELLELLVKGYTERYIINLDLSDSTKNMLKRELRKTFLDEDLFYDLETIAYKESIPKSKVKEIRDKAEVMDYYTLPDVIEDLNKLLEEK